MEPRVGRCHESKIDVDNVVTALTSVGAWSGTKIYTKKTHENL